jgi:hypothetical protein
MLRGKSSIVLGSDTVDLISLQNRMRNGNSNIDSNLIFLTDQLEVIDEQIDGNQKLKQGNNLVANTVASDLKTAGGQLFYIDAGITNIFVNGLKSTPENIHKFYTGISIYFRPIDKNTRTSRFPCKFDLEPRKNCCDTSSNPDFEIATRHSILQHLCLNIGFTLGSMTNKDYDNLINGTSLLVGPAYRFWRAFKVSGGISLLKRSSQNPFDSVKHTEMGGYLGLSVDVDFIQTVKDAYSIIFK